MGLCSACSIPGSWLRSAPMPARQHQEGPTGWLGNTLASNLPRNAYTEAGAHPTLHGLVAPSRDINTRRKKTMMPRTLSLAVMLVAGSAAHAAPPPPYLTFDHSTETLIDKKTAKSLWEPHLTARLARLYPPKKWGFATEVEGGFNQAKTCIITARAMMMPRSGKNLVFTPMKTATAYDALPNATQDQCKDLAKAKLKEAIQGSMAGLMAN